VTAKHPVLRFQEISIKELKVLTSENAVKFTDFNFEFRKLSWAMPKTPLWVGAIGLRRFLRPYFQSKPPPL